MKMTDLATECSLFEKLNVCYGLWILWLLDPAGLGPALFYHAVIYLGWWCQQPLWLIRDCWFRDPADIHARTHTCNTHKCILHSFPCVFCLFHAHKCNLFVYVIQKAFLVILWRMKRAEVSLASSTVHKHRKKIMSFVALAGRPREKEKVTHKIKTEGMERKGSCHIYFLPSVQCLPSLLSSCHLSVS